MKMILGENLRHCAVPTCPTHHKQDVGFYAFPEDPIRREKWSKACKIPLPERKKKVRICWKHFKTNDFAYQIDINDWEECTGTGFGRLKKDTIPSRKLPQDPG